MNAVNECSRVGVGQRAQPARCVARATAAIALAWTLALGVVAPAAAVDAVWPVYDLNPNGTRGAANRNVLQGFGDGSIDSNFVAGLHEGLDILANGQGGQEVAVARSGRVIQAQADLQGFAGNGVVMVRVRVGGTDARPTFETDQYLHLAGITVAVGADLVAGAKVGNIGAPFTAGSNHLHFNVFSGSQTTATIAASQLLNPFARFTADADRDPGGNLPALADTNADGRSVVFTRTGTLDRITSKTVGAGVDIVADIRDNMNPNFLGASGVHQAGYRVRALFDQGVAKHDVGTPAAPYILAKFDDNFFRNGGRALPADLSTSIYATDRSFQVTRAVPVLGFNSTRFALTRNYIVTNTTSNTGAVANIDSAQFWNTKAKDDATVSDGSSRANFAFSNQTAAHNAEARFKDGDYEVHILAGDLTHDLQDLVAGKVRLDNFAQGAAAGRNGAPALAHVNLAPLSNSATPFMAGHNPSDGESAAALFTFLFGETVAVQGDQFYPELRMPVYVVPHQNVWTEGLSFANLAGLLVGDVISDAKGFVGLTDTGYVASQEGEFDLIIDYDRNGAFSATLDGLTGFSVAVPEPRAGWLFVVGLLGLCAAVRRKR